MPAQSTISVDLVGVAPATLQTWLAQAQQALHLLLTGGKPQTVMYGQGDGTKSVTYTRARTDELRVYIGQLQAALDPCGRVGRRRAIALRF